MPIFPTSCKHQDLGINQNNLWGHSKQACVSLCLVIHTLFSNNRLRLPWVELSRLLWLMEKPLRAHSWHCQPLNTPSKKHCCLFTLTLTFLFAVFLTLSKNKTKTKKRKMLFFFSAWTTWEKWSLALRLQATPLLATVVWHCQEEFWNQGAPFGG